MRSSPSRDRFDRAFAREVAAHAETLLSIAELAANGEWHGDGDGAGTLAAWISARCQISGDDARKLVREAEAVAARPALAEAMRSGGVSLSQARAITVLSEEGTDDAAMWLEVLPLWEIADLEREARKKTARDLERRDGGTYLRMSPTPDERYMRGEFQLHPEDGAAVQAAIDDRIPAGTKLRDFDQAAARALVELAKGGLPRSKAPRSKATTTVLLSIDEAVLAGNDGVGTLGSGGFVDPDTSRRLACDSRIQPLFFDGKHKLTGYGRTTRSIPLPLRRAVEERDGGTCTFPGCDHDFFLEVHHIEHFAQGGETELENLLLTCWKHHELVHEGKWSIRGSPGPDVTWIRPDGTVFEPRVRVTLDTS